MLVSKTDTPLCSEMGGGQKPFSLGVLDAEQSTFIVHQQLRRMPCEPEPRTIDQDSGQELYSKVVKDRRQIVL